MPSPFLTNPVARDWLSKRGFDPDDPAVAELASQLGLNLGEQPSTSFGGKVSAFGRSAARSVFDLGRGIADLPLSLGRWTKFTDARIESGRPSPVEQVNPVSSGLGSLVGTLASFAVPETLIGKVGAVSKLKKLGRIEELGLDATELASLANRSTNIRAAGGTAATTDDLLSLANQLSPGFQRGILSGLSPRAMLGRAASTAPSFAAVEALQSGDLDERISRGFKGFVTGATLGALGAPQGLGRSRSALRDSIAAIAAFRTEPVIPDTPIPGILQQVLFGSAFGALKGSKQVFPGEKVFAPTSPIKTPSVRSEPLISQINSIRQKGAPIVDAPIVTYSSGPVPQYRTLRNVGRLPAFGDARARGRIQDNPTFSQADTLYSADFDQPLPREVLKTLNEEFIPTRLLNPHRVAQKKQPIVIRSLREEIPEVLLPSEDLRLNSVLYVRPKPTPAPDITSRTTPPSRQPGPSLAIDETVTESLTMPERQAIADWEFRYGAKARQFDKYLEKRRTEDSSILARAQKKEIKSQHEVAIELFEKQRKLIVEPSAQIIDPSTGLVVVDAEVPRILLPSDLDTYLSPVERGRLSDHLSTTAHSNEGLMRKLTHLSEVLKRSDDPSTLDALKSFEKRLSTLEDIAVQEGLSPTVLTNLAEEQMTRRQSKMKVNTEKFAEMKDLVEEHIKRYHSLFSDICKGM